MTTDDTEGTGRYNGWRNYETWCTALWIDNEPGTHETARDLVLATYSTGEPADWLPSCVSVHDHMRHRAADALKDWLHDESGMIPVVPCSLASDLLSSALDEVNWQEIADGMLEDVEVRA